MSQSASEYLRQLELRHDRILFSFPLTDHLPGHEDEADGTGHEKSPSGQTSPVPLSRRHGARLLAQPAGPPQAVRAGGVLAGLGCRAGQFVLCRSRPERRQNRD